MFPVPKKAAYVKFRTRPRAMRWSGYSLPSVRRMSRAVPVPAPLRRRYSGVTAFEEALKKRFSPKSARWFDGAAEGLNSDLHGKRRISGASDAACWRGAAVEAATGQSVTLPITAASRLALP